VSRLVVEKSAFGRAAMLRRSDEGRLTVAGSAGMDDSTIGLLNGWGEGVGEQERSGKARRLEGSLGVRVGARSCAVVLGTMPAEVGYRRAVVVPLWAMGDRMLGALVVGADGLMGVRRSALAKALEPLEALAFKLERAMENASVAERLARSEKLAGLGLVASGMAHALNNPLTAVLGFAELIANTTTESRVKEDAEIIVREALRMRQTVEAVLEFGRPAGRGEEFVDVTRMVRELAGACMEKLENRGVRLIVQAENEVAMVRGDRDRLRQMMEHLLNNAAQALAGLSAEKRKEAQAIRVSVSVVGAKVHLIVSDTGPGFHAPGRLFERDDSLGLGLSFCLGVVREHGGEISAFNLHPHGAGVAVELPVRDFALKNSEAGAVRRDVGVNV